MNMWLFFLVVHVLGLAGFNLNLRRSLLGKVDQFTLATIMQTGIAIPALFLLIYSPPAFGSYPPQYYIGLSVEVVLTIALHVTNVKSLQYLEASVYPMLYNLRILITTILGILFLSESVVWIRILGGLLILMAIFIVRQKGSRMIRTKGIEWGLAAAFVISFLNMNEKLTIQSFGWLSYIPLAMIISAVAMWAYLLMRRQSVDMSIIFKPQMVQLMILRSISGYAFIFALAAGALISVANYISAMSVIVMVVLGVVLLREKDYLWRKVGATAVAVIGLTIVLLTHL